MTPRIRLGVNIDHVATLRNARGSAYPDPVRAARLACEAGADIVTVHLREDRRHIRDEDVLSIAGAEGIPLNLEMAPTPEMLEIALRVRPEACCLVPERREEITTEGGLDAAALHNHLAPYLPALYEAGIRVSLFVDPVTRQVEAAKALGAPVVELHTGAYADAAASGRSQAAEMHLGDIRATTELAAKIGVEVHAGHGLTYDNVIHVASIKEITELQIGHFLVSESIFSGLAPAVQRMRELMDRARPES